MSSIPQFLRSIIELHLNELLAWFSDYVYQQIGGMNPNHPLRRLNELLAWNGLETACRGYHRHNGMGCPITHTTERLVRALVVRYFYDYSLRETEAAIGEQIAVKQFVGYPLHHRGLSYSTLGRFEQYVCEHHPRLFFDTVLRQIDAAFPHQRLRPQVADTFAMLANAQLETLTGRLRHAAALLLLAVHRHSPPVFDQLAGVLDLPALVGSPGERREFLLTASEKQHRLVETVTQVVHLLRLLEGTVLAGQGVRRYAQMLRAVLEKEVEVTEDEAGHLQRVRVYSEAERGTFRPTSATDPDATIRNHGAGKRDHAYNVHLAATTDFVREITATTGSQPDAAGIVPLLEAQQAQHQLCPAKLVYDQAAGQGHTIATVSAATEGQTQLVVKPVQAGKCKKGDRLGPLDCTLAEQPDPVTGEPSAVLVCPAGQTTAVRYRAGTAMGWTYRMPAATCAGCSLALACRGTAVQPRHPRQWFISDYHAPVLAAHAYARTAAFAQDMKLRPHIERIIAALVLHCGARHARFRGRPKVDFQVKMCATTYNLKRWLNLSDPGYKTRPRRTAAAGVLRLAARR
jgi:hypothetical protein